MSSSKPEVYKAQPAQTTACDYRVGDVKWAATFQTFCFGPGFSKAYHFGDKIRQQRWPFSLFGVRYIRLLFCSHTFQSRFTSFIHPPQRGRNEYLRGKLKRGHATDATWHTDLFCIHRWNQSQWCQFSNIKAAQRKNLFPNIAIHASVSL